MIIETDASTTAWVAHQVGGITIGDQWSALERTLHINVLELKAVELALKTILRHSNPSSIHLRIDNTTALSYLVKMGGTKCPSLNTISKRVWEFLLKRDISLTASWIPSKENILRTRGRG